MQIGVLDWRADGYSPVERSCAMDVWAIGSAPTLTDCDNLTGDRPLEEWVAPAYGAGPDCQSPTCLPRQAATELCSTTRAKMAAKVNDDLAENAPYGGRNSASDYTIWVGGAAATRRIRTATRRIQKTLMI